MLLQYFDKYVSAGLRPIAVHKDSKRPVGEAWNLNWTVERWRPHFESGQYNMGILLGDIVDVEGDTEEANDLLERMIDGASRPKFRSSKSIHNLFINPDPKLTRLVVGGIEFRANLHQSVVPPSTHSDGRNYNWLAGSIFPIPPMPPELRAFYERNKKTDEPKPRRRIVRSAPRQKKDHAKTQCKTCLNKYFIHKKRLMLEVRVFQSIGCSWMCRECRKMDVRESVRHLRLDLEKQEIQMRCRG